MVKPLEKGFKIGNKYKIDRVIGRGATVIAYKVLKDTPCGKKRCLLKEVSPISLNLERCSDGRIFCPEEEKKEFEEKKKRFIKTLQVEEKIRFQKALVNELPGSLNVFKENGTLYAEVPFYKGRVLLEANLDLTKYLRAMLAAAKTLLAFHREGFLVLDIKPSNIFVLQDALGNPITDMVLFIDAGSVVNKFNVETEILEFTDYYAAPELYQSQKRYLISERTDFYALSECLFVYLFKRHSNYGEHRGFSTYPFENIPYIRLEAKNLLIELFRGTLRPSPENRFESAECIIEILNKLILVLEEKVYPVSRRPLSQGLIGREKEKNFITNTLCKEGLLFVTGIAGIGKTSLIEGWMAQNNNDYSEIIYLKYERDIIYTFNNDFLITTVKRYVAETDEDFFIRKLHALERFSKNKKVLIVIDNYEGQMTKELEKIISGPFFVILAGREVPIKEYVNVLEVGPLEKEDEMKCLFERHLGKKIRNSDILHLRSILKSINGHTLFIVLLAKQVAASHLNIAEVDYLVENPGFTIKFKEKVSFLTDDGEERKRLCDILKEIIKKSGVANEKIELLKVFAMFAVPIGFENLRELNVVESFDDVNDLIRNGFLFTWENKVYLPPIFLEGVKNLPESEKQKNALLMIMKRLKEATDEENLFLSENLIKGCSNMKYEKDYVALLYHVFKHMASYREGEILETGEMLIDLSKDNILKMKVYVKLLEVLIQKGDIISCEKILKTERVIASKDEKDEVKAFYFESLAAYYDAILSGAYDAKTKEEKCILRKLLNALKREAVLLKKLPEKKEEEVRIFLSLATILSRSNPERNREIFAYYNKAYESLKQINMPSLELIRDYHMASAWMWIYVKPHLKNMEKHLHKALKAEKEIAKDGLSLTEFIIPAVNMYLELGEYEKSIYYLQMGIEICNERSESLPYRRMRDEILSYQREVYSYFV